LHRIALRRKPDRLLRRASVLNSLRRAPKEVNGEYAVSGVRAIQ